MRIHALLAMMLGLSLSDTGCSRHRKPQGHGEYPDLIGQFHVLQTAGESSGRRDQQFSRHYPVTRRGIRLDSMVLVAPVAVGAPVKTIQGGRSAFVCLAAPVFNIGDGLEMDVFLTSGGTGKRIYQRYFDAARRWEDRDWIPLYIPLETSAAVGAELQIRVSGGPQGDLVDDWLALSQVHIESRDASR